VTRPVTLPRRQREKADRQAAILSAARQVFFEHGIRDATVDDIAARAQVAKGTVYIYFRSKETILATLLLEGLDSLYARLERAFDEGGHLAAEARLRKLAQAYLQFYKDEPDYFRLMMAFDRGQFREAIRPELYETILHRSLSGLHWLVRAIQQGVETGEFAPGDPSQTAGICWAAINGALVLSGHPLRRQMLGQDVDTLYEGVFNTMLAGIKKP
jgi:AcrR family transcriptional regulator